MRPRRVAVLVNPRAQGATRARLRWLAAHVAPRDLYVPDGVDAARDAIAAIAAGGYDVVCVAGGDGAFMLAARALIALAPARVPALFPLRFGTGNAVHDVSAASPPTRRGLARDLARAADPATTIAPLRLLEVNGQLAQFAGVGLDADWAADYAWLIKRHVGTGPLLPLVRGVPGYAATALALTIPRLVRRPFIAVRVIARGTVTRLGTAGPAIPDGGVLYDGRATMVSASTVASYSAGFPYFQHVDQIGDAFELKIAIAGALTVLRTARRSLLGAADPRHVLDFAAHGVTIELASPLRYHVGGDVLPPVSTITVLASRHAVPVVRAG
ncbi:MAG TPA: diacylglycerol kinase family protein [Kofleriaceae bacterium]|nr:diacylglycerol kinase family protein [Kofleriaceae bacterium]